MRKTLCIILILIICFISRMAYAENGFVESPTEDILVVVRVPVVTITGDQMGKENSFLKD